MSEENLKKLKSLSRFVSETANMVPLHSRPFVGRSAFAHKGGVHVSAIMKHPEAYEHMDPERVGNHRRVLVSDLSGRSNVEYKARELGLDIELPDGPTAAASWPRSSSSSRTATSSTRRTAPSRSSSRS